MKTVYALLAVLGVVGLAACNTISGAGEDISSGGRAITDTADQTQQEITQ